MRISVCSMLGCTSRTWETEANNSYSWIVSLRVEGWQPRDLVRVGPWSLSPLKNGHRYVRALILAHGSKYT
eukprot:526286-Pyramimonas_sp.AAC.1